MALFLGFMQVFSLFRSYFLDNADPFASRVSVVLGSVIMLTIWVDSVPFRDTNSLRVAIGKLTKQ